MLVVCHKLSNCFFAALVTCLQQEVHVHDCIENIVLFQKISIYPSHRDFFFVSTPTTLEIPVLFHIYPPLEFPMTLLGVGMDKKFSQTAHCTTDYIYS